MWELHPFSFASEHLHSFPPPLWKHGNGMAAMKPTRQVRRGLGTRQSIYTFHFDIRKGCASLCVCVRVPSPVKILCNGLGLRELLVADDGPDREPVHEELAHPVSFRQPKPKSRKRHHVDVERVPVRCMRPAGGSAAEKVKKRKRHQFGKK